MNIGIFEVGSFAVIFLLGMLVDRTRQALVTAREQAKRFGINVIEGFVLPEPDDLRWEMTADAGGTLKLGDVVVYSVSQFNRRVDCGGVILWTVLPAKRVQDYGAAVLRAYAERRALASIDPPPAKEPLALEPHVAADPPADDCKCWWCEEKKEKTT